MSVTDIEGRIFLDWLDTGRRIISEEYVAFDLHVDLSIGF